MRIRDNILYLVEESDIIDGVLELPDTVQTIGKKVIINLPSLKRFVANGLKIVREDNFNNCNNLEDFKADNLLEIESYCFLFCSCLKDIELPNLLSVGNYSFENCGRLKNAKFTKLSEDDLYFNFWRCNSIKSITIKDKKLNIKCVDGRCTVIQNTKKVKGYTVHKANKLGFCEYFYLAEKGGLEAHGNTIREVIENLEFNRNSQLFY